MERITIFLRTTKSEGTVKMRFRLRDGRKVDLYHKSDIVAELKELAKFDDNGEVKPRVSVFNKELKDAIDQNMNAMHLAYVSLCEKFQASNITGDMFETEVERQLNPESMRTRNKELSIVDRLRRYADDGFRDGVFDKSRRTHYYSLSNALERFLIIKGLKNICAAELDANMVMDFRSFLFDEYQLTEKYAHVYDGRPGNQCPKKRRSGNTVVQNLKALQAFLTEQEEREEIVVSPFRKLGRNRKASVMHRFYNEPVYLLKDELLRIQGTAVPEELTEVKDYFLLHCAIGCRLGDFLNLTMENISVSLDGIPFVHYLAHKTLRDNTTNVEIKTPILRHALDIIKRRKFQFPMLSRLHGEERAVEKIRKLLKFCGIDRKCTIYDEASQTNKYVPIYEIAGTRLCRRTHVDMMSKVQVNLYASGLHKVGSPAVHHYTSLQLADRFMLMCAAYDQPVYHVDKDLNVISGEKE